MATLATAELPSDDEEDSDYEPDTARADSAADMGDGTLKNGKRRKKEAGAMAAARASKQAKRVDDIWANLRAQSGGSASTSAPSSAQPGRQADAGGGASDGSAAAQRASGSLSRLNVADFCRPVPKKQKGIQDESWKRQLGLGPQKQQAASSSGQQDAVAVAAAALEAAKATATTDQYGRTVVTETRKFAGQTIQMRKAVAGGSAAKEIEQKKALTGLDAMLAAIQGAKKATVLDKSKADWDVHKKEAGIDADLAQHQRSANRFVDKQDFLARSEVREYEKERDARLNSDVRNRSRA